MDTLHEERYSWWMPSIQVIQMVNGYDPVSPKRSQPLSQSNYSNRKSCYSRFSYKMRYAGHHKMDCWLHDTFVMLLETSTRERTSLWVLPNQRRSQVSDSFLLFTKQWQFRSDFAPVPAPAMALPQPSGTPAKVPNARITGLFRRKNHKNCLEVGTLLLSLNPVLCGELLVVN